MDDYMSNLGKLDDKIGLPFWRFPHAQVSPSTVFSSAEREQVHWPAARFPISFCN
jgi:hypothetical protein